LPSPISRRVFMKLSCLLATISIPFPGCNKRAEPSNNSKPIPSGDLIRLSDDCGPVLFGMPIILCGAVVKEKPTFNLLGNFGILSLGPPRPVVYISTDEKHYTNIGIREHEEFSVCFPHQSILAKADYCGVHSGHTVDKSRIFNVQYGSLKNAPLVKDCYICFACRVIQRTKINTMDVFYGEIIEKFGSAACVVNGKPDPEKIKPIAFGPVNAYRAVDTVVGTPWSEYRKIS